MKKLVVILLIILLTILLGITILSGIYNMASSFSALGALGYSNIESAGIVAVCIIVGILLFFAVYVYMRRKKK